MSYVCGERWGGCKLVRGTNAHYRRYVTPLADGSVTMSTAHIRLHHNMYLNTHTCYTYVAATYLLTYFAATFLEPLYSKEL